MMQGHISSCGVMALLWVVYLWWGGRWGEFLDPSFFLGNFLCPLAGCCD